MTDLKWFISADKKKWKYFCLNDRTSESEPTLYQILVIQFFLKGNIQSFSIKTLIRSKKYSTTYLTKTKNFFLRDVERECCAGSERIGTVGSAFFRNLYIIFFTTKIGFLTSFVPK